MYFLPPPSLFPSPIPSPSFALDGKKHISLTGGISFLSGDMFQVNQMKADGLPSMPQEQGGK